MSKFIKIKSIGVEIEGGWDKNRTDLIPDGSVHAGDFSNSVVTGELVSKPFNDIDTCLKFVQDNWPTEATQRCGLHSHIQLQSINSYTQLMSPDFYEYFLKEMTAFGKKYPVTNQQFWDRLENKNTFCKKLFIPEKQVKIVKKTNSDANRYTHLNYCFGVHKTLECRLFPTFHSYETAQAALCAFVDCVESYLDKAAPIKEIIEEEISFEDDAPKNSDESVEVKTNTFKLKPFNLYENMGNFRPLSPIKESRFKIYGGKVKPVAISDFETLISSTGLYQASPISISSGEDSQF